ncbi:MAG: MscL family protein [Candidatus Omnitrophota bacterium]|jgi:large conductance mechanosensitive channel
MRDIKLKEEFIEFIRTYGVIGVAIGIVMGNAVAKIINAIVEGLIMPLIEMVLPGPKWQEAVLHLGRASIKIGVIIAAFIDFFAIAIVVFFMVKYVLKVEVADNQKTK